MFQLNQLLVFAVRTDPGLKYTFCLVNDQQGNRVQLKTLLPEFLYNFQSQCNVQLIRYASAKLYLSGLDAITKRSLIKSVTKDDKGAEFKLKENLELYS